MSKKSKSKNQSSRRRVISNPNANRRLPPTLSLPRSIYQSPSKALSQIEDRRTYHPEGDFRPAASFSKPRHRLEVPRAKHPHRQNFQLAFRSVLNNGRIAFKAPEKVLVCVRRQRRKEVLHALKKSGKTGQRKPRQSYLSSVTCNQCSRKI